jgi:RNA polymerase sigma factor (TIGR02999 family)
MEHEITRLLDDLSNGNRTALDRLLPLVYDELQRMAHAQLRRERDGHTLNTSALVHEAYLKLVEQRTPQWQGRNHFFAIASIAMRRVLVNYAKARGRQKRGGGDANVRIDESNEPMSDQRAEEIVSLDEALERLAAINQRAASVVECRYFGGLSIEQTAEALGVAPMTVKRDWMLAKTWLKKELTTDD